MIHVEILQGLTRDQLTSELIVVQLERENKALREISEEAAPGVVTSGGSL